MNKEQLKARLEQEKVNPNAYSIFGLTSPPSGEQYVLDYDKKAGKWFTYHYHGGAKSGLESFSDENKACEYLLKLLLKDASNRLSQ